MTVGYSRVKWDEPIEKILGKLRVAPALVATGAMLVTAFIASVATGSWGIPHNDDWAFTKIAEQFSRTGNTSLIGWNNMTVVGQTFILGPLAGSVLVRHLFVGACAVITLACCYQATRRQSGSWWAGVAVLGLVVTPPFLLLSTSFMTDLPSLGLSLTCVVLGGLALRRDSFFLLILSLGVAIWACAIRDTAVAAPASVLLVHIAHSRGRRLVRIVLAGLGFAVAFLVLEVWRRSLDFGMNPVLSLSLKQGLRQTYATYFTISLFLFPLILGTILRRRWSPGAWWAMACTLAIAIVGGLSKYEFLMGNYFSRFGAYSAAASGTRTLWLTDIFWMFHGLAAVSGALLAGALFEGVRKVEKLWVLFGALSSAALLVPTFLGQGEIDRYVLPLMVPVILAILPVRSNDESAAHRGQFVERLPTGAWRLALKGALCFWGFVALTLTLNALAFDGARWSEAESLVRSGVQATDINAGLEWEGYKSASPADDQNRGRSSWFWATSMFANSRDCFIISASPLRGLTQIDVRTYRTYTFLGQSKIYTYDTMTCSY